MAHREAYESLLAKLYDGVATPEGFQSFIEELVRVFAVRSAALVIFHDDTHAVKELWQHGVPRGAMERYALEFAQEDMLAHHIATSPIAHFYASNHLPDQEGILKSRFFREWALPQDLAYAAGSILLREGAWSTHVYLQRSSAHAPFSREEMDILDRLVPHMQRAMQMRARFAELQMGQDFLAGGLDLLAMPAIFFDEHSRVAYMNKRAHGMLEEHTLLQVEHDHLVVKHLETDRKLNYEIGNAIRASRGVAEFNEVVLLPRAGHLPLMLMVAPVRVTGQVRGAALLFVFDPDAVPTLTVARVRKLFSLTDAEARLAVSLSRGMTLDDIAGERPVSLNTLKTQLKSVFAKTGTRRQAELISLLLASPAYFLADIAAPFL